MKSGRVGSARSNQDRSDVPGLSHRLNKLPKKSPFHWVIEFTRIFLDSTIEENILSESIVLWNRTRNHTPAT